MIGMVTMIVRQRLACSGNFCAISSGQLRPAYEPESIRERGALPDALAVLGGLNGQLTPEVVRTPETGRGPRK